MRCPTSYAPGREVRMDRESAIRLLCADFPIPPGPPSYLNGDVVRTKVEAGRSGGEDRGGGARAPPGSPKLGHRWGGKNQMESLVAAEERLLALAHGLEFSRRYYAI